MWINNDLPLQSASPMYWSDCMSNNSDYIGQNHCQCIWLARSCRHHQGLPTHLLWLTSLSEEGIGASPNLCYFTQSVSIYTSAWAFTFILSPMRVTCVSYAYYVSLKWLFCSLTRHFPSRGMGVHCMLWCWLMHTHNYETCYHRCDPPTHHRSCQASLGRVSSSLDDLVSWCMSRTFYMNH